MNYSASALATVSKLSVTMSVATGLLWLVLSEIPVLKTSPRATVLGDEDLGVH